MHFALCKRRTAVIRLYFNHKFTSFGTSRARLLCFCVVAGLFVLDMLHITFVVKVYHKKVTCIWASRC
jgi:hypothetical protein